MKLTAISNDTWYASSPIQAPNYKTPQIVTMTMETEYKGDFEGVSVASYAMAAYNPHKTEGEEGCAGGHGDWTFAGIATFAGTVQGKKGTFATRVTGQVRHGWSEATNTIVEGTGTDELAGISGSGCFKVQVPKESRIKDLEVQWEVEFK
ncbi:hypothetical protein CcaverHIS002_0704360 [Cutaneotrichosporon cavernicola]|uniref:Uncharacterized protein n=1 Tax=Cutaneotrichosporon cavernicola TaxID=279322 RepID=A0AA48QYZ7_9TREE|nr:uncharacterized protein CcaverHIS019_0704440 [Cutaneotrichosporon cavernicola]BEI87090.1 hypothetical protein CcaverHIS002_0704360 [Cutaneotrichosporon cavernicola]BEI94863.1 hypothetical protein CcaverHIS019_0704440 [Cutaneotrichosporon cavernicola]BEJ02636.1 hypothetical protein CcaverHIS631_0704310 [Cutaneotrichosporon cavernicola]BEJ10393.1 hypothetical protein CcaverHIS641_0704280 [Cutaneotrichosporon cavernicola]